MFPRFKLPPLMTPNSTKVNSTLPPNMRATHSAPTKSPNDTDTEDFDPCMDFIAYLNALHEHDRQLRRSKKSPEQLLVEDAPHLYVSDAGQCLRKVHYSLQDRTRNIGNVNPSMSILAALGDFLHKQYISMLHTKYPFLQEEVSWSYQDTPNPQLPPLISGRCDGIYLHNNRSTLLEIKSKSKYQYKQIIKSGIPLTENALQAALSAWHFKTQDIEIVYICREFLEDEDPVISFRYPFNPQIAIQELNRLRKAYNPFPEREMCGTILNPNRDRTCNFCPFQSDCQIDMSSVSKP